MNPASTARLTFRIHYTTQWGEAMLLERRTAGASRGAVQLVRLPMQSEEGGYWGLALDGLGVGACLDYRYVLRGREGDIRREPVFRSLEVLGHEQVVFDQWLASESADAAFLRQAFAGVIFQPSTTPTSPLAAPAGPRLRLTIRAPRVTTGFRLCISGDHPRFGDWDPARTLVMSGEQYPLWQVELPLSAATRSIEYKFGLWQDAAQRLVLFEQGANRRIEPLPQDEGCICINAEHFRHDTLWKGAGVAIPVFSLRSERGYGIGEFTDLGPFAAWAAGCGMHLVQVLPVNDTSSDFTWRDSYPYKAISTAALHPIYLNLEDLFAEYRLPLPEGYLERRAALNRLPHVDYETVLKDKLAYLRQLYAAVGAQALASRGFKSFWRQQADWLRPYAAFCCLRDRHGTADFTSWGEYATYAESKVRPFFRASAPEYAEVMFHALLQYHLKQQFDRSRAAGHALGVAFKGDLPIGIDRRSVEAWTEPGLFHMDRQTGAPPDPFSALGQNWGFPTYNWRRMEADDYAWWRKRFQRMSACFDALRIDHILGFFRIWEIPAEYREGIMGHFNPTRPLSREEIRAEGFTRDPGQFAVPAIAEARLVEFFGAEAPRMAAQLLVRERDGFFRLRPEFAKADARRAWAEAGDPGMASESVRQGLTRLGYEVLFVRDPEQPGQFHPRIALAETALFQSLDRSEQSVMRALHDDFFYRRHTRFWEAEAMKKLPALLDATGMLLCGEDLGMIPDSVPVVLKRLGLLSLEVQRMPKQLGRTFSEPQAYPYLSVCTTSTHDMATVRGLWEEDQATRRAFYRQVMRRDGEPPAEATTEVCRFIVEQNLAATSMWCILPWQDWLALDAGLRHPRAAEERINVPANPRHYWRYRMHMTIEDLMRAEEFNRLVARMIQESGRRPAR